MNLTASARAELEERFAVPVLDLYGLEETGALAVSVDGGPHRVVPRRLHVETLRPDGSPAAELERGEVTVTVEENPLLPLLRYRTGDHARLERRADGSTWLHDLDGRSPVRLRARDGRWVPTVDLTQLLQHHGVRGWALHQHAAGAVTVRVAGGSTATVRSAVAALLDVEVTVVPEPRLSGRGVTSDVPGA